MPRAPELKLSIDLIQVTELARAARPTWLIIPELLSTDQPDAIPFEKTGALAFEFLFRGFLPRHVMPELIVNRHEEIVQKIVWQRGVLLKHNIHHAQALLQVDYHDRVLSIWVQGRDANVYLSLLNDEVLKILKRLDLYPEERVELPLSACIDLEISFDVSEKADYRQLLNSVRNGNYTFYGKHHVYDLRKVMGIIMPEAELSKLNINQFFNGDYTGSKTVTTINQSVNNSNINGSVIAAEKIENSFNNLQKSKANSEIKILLEQLLIEIKVLNDKVPDSQAHQLVDMFEGAETIVSETGRESPRKKWYEASLEGIKNAALAVGAIAKPVLEIAEKLAPLLL